MSGLGLILSAGAGQMPWGQSADPIDVSAGSVGSGDIRGARSRVFAPSLVTNLSVIVGGASGNIQLGIMEGNPAIDTLALVAWTPSTAAVGTNALQTIALAAPFVKQPGVDYYDVWQADNGTITLYRTTGAVGTLIGKQSFLKTGVSYGLDTNATSISSLNFTNQPIPWIAWS